MNNDDLISTSETRTGDTGTAGKANVPIDFPHDHGLPGFAAPIGFVDGTSRQTNSAISSRLPSAEFTTDGAGFILDDDSSQKSSQLNSVPSSVLESPAGPMRDDQDSLSPTRIIYQEVPAPLDEDSPFKHPPGPSPSSIGTSSSSSSSTDAEKIIPNLPFGSRTSSFRASNNLKVTQNQPSNQITFKPASSTTSIRSNGKELSQQQQKTHNSIRVMTASSVNNEQQQQQQQLLNQQKSHQIKATSKAIHPSQSIIHQSQLPHPLLTHNLDHQFHQQQNQISNLQQQQQQQQQVNPFVNEQFISSESTSMIQPPKQLNHNQFSPSSYDFSSGYSNILSHSNEIFDERSLLRPSIQLPGQPNFVTSILQHQQQQNLPNLTPSGSVNGQKLPVFIKSDSNNDQITAPSMSSGYYINNPPSSVTVTSASSSFDQEMSPSHSYPSSLPLRGNSKSGQHEYSNVDGYSVVKEVTTKEGTIESNTIPLGMPLAGILLHRQNQQKLQRRQTEVTVSKSLHNQDNQEMQFHSPSTSSSSSSQSIDVKPGKRFSSQILPKQIITLEKSKSENNLMRFKRHTNVKYSNKMATSIVGPTVGPTIGTLSTLESRFVPSSNIFESEHHLPPSIYDIGQSDFHHFSSSRRRLTHTGNGRRNHHRRNSNPSNTAAATESKSFGILGSGNFEVIRGGIYKGSGHDSHLSNYGSHTSHTRPHIHHINGDEYDDVTSSKKFQSYGSLGDEELFNSSKDPVFGFQGYDNFQLASNQEEELKKHDTYSTVGGEVEDHTASASNSYLTSLKHTNDKKQFNSLVQFDQDLMAIA